MPVLAWASDNWFALIQTLGIIAGLIFTATSLRLDARARKIGNLLTITSNHRAIWSELYTRPELSRVIDKSVDLARSPITPEEQWLIRFVIFHLNSVYYALKDDLLLSLQGLPKDIQWFFSLPLPRAVWEKIRMLQDPDFVKFVESCLTPIAAKT